MRQVGPSLLQRRDRVPHRHRAAAEARGLREDEPHPVATLAAPAQLGDDRVVDGPLRLDEPLEVERGAQDPAITWIRSGRIATCTAPSKWAAAPGSGWSTIHSRPSTFT